ncbi:MAG: 5'/3'-nucleotidase SurE [Bacteroidetes bacterium]|nr:5'/3'-nucleotidase SurE [Bacteroidota bacterium]
MQKKLILITNDDGIFSPGILALAEELQTIADIIVVAPNKQQSAVGHAITITTAIHKQEVELSNKIKGIAVDGTPADCVKLAVRTILPKKPDLIVSGINHGHNTAVSIMYSGTVSAATEGVILEIPSIAISVTTFEDTDFLPAAVIAKKVSEIVLQKSLPEGMLLNINVPAIPLNEIKGIEITHQGKSVWDDFFEKRLDSEGKEYFWLKGNLNIKDKNIDSDQGAILNNYVSITPIQFDLTDYKRIDLIKEMGFNKIL